MSEKIELKEWLFKLNDDEYEVHTKDGIFIIEDVAHKKIKSAQKRGEKSNSIQECILAEMIKSKDGVEERIGELAISDYKTSTFMRLSYVMNEVMGVKDFQEQFSE